MVAWHGTPWPDDHKRLCEPIEGAVPAPRANRAITLREAAMLQSFPKRYFFSLEKGKFAVAALIGNALPPEFIRRHARKIYKFLENWDAQHRRSSRAKLTRPNQYDARWTTRPKFSPWLAPALVSHGPSHIALRG